MNMPTPFFPPRTEPLDRVLLVDDEPAILNGLRRQLRRNFDVTVALGGEEALALMADAKPFAVVLSDMRMPGMDGASFLAVVRERHPETVRMLLTGQADMQSTIAAINDGQIYRFLSKPCAAEAMQTALQDASALYRQITAERDVLERTLRGAVKALLDALSLASPQAFSRAVRVSQLVGELAEMMDLPVDWELNISGQLAQLGAVTLPVTVLEKLDAGRPLSRDEQAMVEAVPGVSQRLIAEIPRLAPLASAIGQQGLRYDGQGSRPGSPKGEDLPLAARLLKMAIEIDRMRSQRLPPPTILKLLRDDAGAYDPRLLELWEQSHIDPDSVEPVPVLAELKDLEIGMVIAEEILNSGGVLLVGRGSSVTEALLQRINNHAQQGMVSGPVLVTRATR